MMYCDLDLKVQYINPASIKTLKRLEQYLPIKAEEMIGKSIDIFHKNPEHQRRLLADPKNLPHETVIQLGPESVEPARDRAPRQVRATTSARCSPGSIVTEQLAAKQREAETAADTNALNQLLQALGQAGSKFEVARLAALGTIREAFGWPYATYFELDPTDHALKFAARLGLGRRGVPQGLSRRARSAKERGSTVRPGGPKTWSSPPSLNDRSEAAPGLPPAIRSGLQLGRLDCRSSSADRWSARSTFFGSQKIRPLREPDRHPQERRPPGDSTAARTGPISRRRSMQAKKELEDGRSPR